MHYSLGCAFNLEDIIYNFPFSKLEINCKQCQEAIGNNHRQILVKRIFKESVKIIIQDVIDRNVTFWLPLVGAKKCNIHMKRVTGKSFQKLRQTGKWEDVDFLASNFSGYEIGFFMLGKRTPRTKTIYVSKELRKQITNNTNLGKQYGDGVIDTKISDYYQQVQELFPTVPIKDIKRILNYTWKFVYLHNSYGGDLIITDSKFWCYFGKLRKNSVQHFHYYIKKLITKIRVHYKRKGKPFTGYYYFALSDSQYESYIAQINKKGRPKKKFQIGPIMLYEILDECRLNEFNYKYICRTPYICPIKLKYYNSNLYAPVELIEKREPLKFKDILTSENDYI